MHSVLLLPGDGQGPEAMDIVEMALGEASDRITVTRGDIGFPAYERYGDPVPFETLDQVGRSRTVVCGPCMCFGDMEVGPVDSLLSQLDLYARTRTFRTFGTDSDIGMTFWGSRIETNRDVAETESVDGVTISKYIRSEFFARMMGLARSDMEQREIPNAVCIARQDLFPESTRVFRDQFEALFDGGSYSDIGEWICDAVDDPGAYRFMVVSDLFLSAAEGLGAGLTGGYARTPTRYVGDGFGIVTFGDCKDGSVDAISPFLAASEALLDLSMVDEARNIVSALTEIARSGLDASAPDFVDRVLAHI